MDHATLQEHIVGYLDMKLINLTSQNKGSKGKKHYNQRVLMNLIRKTHER